MKFTLLKISTIYKNRIFHSNLSVSSLSPSIWSSALMAVGGMGDALLYVYLPVKGEALGLTAFSIGLLLSINKFARFFTNRAVAYISCLWGIKNILFFAVVISSIATFIYALNPGIWVWIISRLFWGAAFSVFRFSTTQYAGKSSKPGSALGIGRSIQEFGPLLVYWVGPFMLISLGAGFTFTALGLILVLLLPTLQLLPDVQYYVKGYSPFNFQRPQWVDVWVFISAFVIEGIMVVGVSRLVDFDVVPKTDTIANYLLWISAFYISVRRLLNIVMAPLSGWLSDKFGFAKIFRISCSFMALGYTFIVFGMESTGVLLAFIGSAMNFTLVPIKALQVLPIRKKLDALTRISTSRDTGSALGSLLGLNLLGLYSPGAIFTIVIFITIPVWFKIRKLKFYYD